MDTFHSRPHLLCRDAECILTFPQEVTGHEQIEVCGPAVAKIEAGERSAAGEVEPLLMPEERSEDFGLQGAEGTMD